MSGGVGVRTRPVASSFGELRGQGVGVYPAAYGLCPRCKAPAGFACVIRAAGKVHERAMPHRERTVVVFPSAGRAGKPARSARPDGNTGAVLSTAGVARTVAPDTAIADNHVLAAIDAEDVAGPPPYYCELFAERF